MLILVNPQTTLLHALMQICYHFLHQTPRFLLLKLLGEAGGVRTTAEVLNTASIYLGTRSRSILPSPIHTSSRSRPHQGLSRRFAFTTTLPALHRLHHLLSLCENLLSAPLQEREQEQDR
jgi:hypothetical protein